MRHELNDYEWCVTADAREPIWIALVSSVS